MKKVFRFFYVSALLMAVLTVFMPFNKAGKTVSAATASIPEGQTLDANPDVISISDLTLPGGYTNQSALNKLENTDVTYNKTNANGSLVFKFIYEINDDTKTDARNVRVHFDVADDKWNDSNSYMFRGDKTLFRYWNGSEYKWDETKALEKGTYNIELGRIALFDASSAATGSYYCYMKIDGVVRSSAITAYDVTKMDNTMFINIGQNVLNTKNPIYDADLTFEEPQYISVRDLQNTNILAPKNAYKYDLTTAPTNKSVVFVADLVNKSDDYPNFFIGGSGTFNNGEKDIEFNYYNGGSISPRQTEVYIYKTDDTTGLVVGNAKKFDYPAALEIGSDKVYRIEYGRLAIMDGDTFTGRYHVYYKVNGQYLGALDNKLLDGVAAGGYFRIGGFANDLVDVYTYEEPKVISVSDLSLDGNLVGESHTITTTGGERFTWDNSDHKANYSIDFKCKYTPVGTSENQFHFNKTDIWSYVSSVIVNRSGVQNYVGLSDDWKKGADFTYVSGTTYDMEYIRQAVLLDGVFTGKYYVCLKMNDTIIKEGICYIPAADAQYNQLFISPGDKQSTIADINPATYETADVISVSDLKAGDTSSDVIVADGAHVFTYEATAEHKSVKFQFVYDYKASTSNNDIYSQIHFSDGYITTGGVPWLRTDRIFITTSTGYTYTNSSPFTAAGKYNVEIGKLYMTGGKNAGKYLIYVSVNGTELLSYIADTMPDKACVMTTGTTNDRILDVNYNDVSYETADIISVSDLKSVDSIYGEALIGSEYIMTRNTSFGYDATAEHKSVIFKFLYDVTNTDPACQFHFNDTWLGNAGGTIWFQKDGTFIQKKADPAAYIKVAKISGSTLHNVELGKIYITGGDDAGKYRIYAKVDGEVIIEYVIDSMPDKARLFLTGSNGDAIYDVDYMPVELDSNLYTYWTESSSGVQFVAEFGKRFKNVMNFSEVGFIITPAGGSPIKLQGRLVESGNNYVVKAAVANMDEAHITKEFTAEFYYVLTSGEQHSCKVSSSLFAELKAQPSLSEGLQAVKNKVLEVVIDEDTMEATGAVKSGDASSIVLTGTEPSYFEYVVNGEVLVNNSLIMIGYTTYKATVEANVITLTKQAKDMVYGGSEHFYETNKGHDENMTAQNLSVMTSNLGLTTVRMDIYLSNLFEVKNVDGNDELVLNNSYRAQVQSVIDELKANGGVVDFLAVLWTVQPTGFKTWEGEPWGSNTAPNPSTQAEMYLKWLQLNGEAARRCAQLFPDVNYFETWNEAELSEVLVKPADGGSYSTAEKALILTDLMYYFNEGIKAANPKNILTTNSLCCSQQTNDRFAVTSQGFLRALYEEITDNDPVTGKSLDKDPNNYFQVINIHPYIGLGTTASNWKAFVKGFNDIAVEFGDGGTQVWITEFGYNNVASKQSDLLDILGKANEIDCLTRFYFYKVHDYTDKIDKDRWGLYNNDCTIKAVGTAVKDFIAE